MVKTTTPVVHSDPGILGGTPVFVGTRVPVQSLFDYIEGGDTLDEFLRQFPSVRREQAIAALELARESPLTATRRTLGDDENDPHAAMTLKRIIGFVATLAGGLLLVLTALGVA